MTLWQIQTELAQQVDRLSFGPPVTHVYNPPLYAEASFRAYLERYGSGRPEAVLLGMNPGPFGMAQTGVPFGDPEVVRDFLGIEAPVGRPAVEHPKRPVLGFACPRREVSGGRLWGWARQRFGTADRFFERFLVLNYCPLAFMEASGRNRTPDKLPAAERDPLFAICDEGLRRSVALLRPRLVVGIGAFAEARARHALPDVEVKIGRVLHPSPASPKANAGWAEAAEGDLRALGIALPRDAAPAAQRG